MSTPATSNASRVTIVMIARERHALTEPALDCLVKNTPRPYRLIYTDGQTPEWLWQKLESHTEEWGLELVRYDEPIWPQALRNLILPTITSEYVVFIDNDVAVHPGWLENLVSCADETNAGIVGPLYLWGDGISPPLIHMAGGFLKRINRPEGELLVQDHLYENAPAAEIVPKLQRAKCDNVEFHCMLVRTSALKAIGGFTESILNVHEHIDASMSLETQGYPTYLEPKSVVNFLHFSPYRLEDIPLFRWRWSKKATEASIQAFCDKWEVLNHPEAFDNVRRFTAYILPAGVDPIRSNALEWTDAAAPLHANELAQTRSQLLDQAIAKGYTDTEVRQLSDGYRLAQAIMDGGYRPCGRPFVNHLVGTASLLIRYGFKIEMVLAGLLHAFYDHAPHIRGGNISADQFLASLMGGKNSPVESRVRAYTFRNSLFRQIAAIDTDHLYITHAEIILLTFANQIEMMLSGEIRYTGRVDSLPPPILEHALKICDKLQITGMAKTYQENSQPLALPNTLQTNLNVSYRFKEDKKQMVSMVHVVLQASDDPFQTPIQNISHIPAWLSMS